MGFFRRFFRAAVDETPVSPAAQNIVELLTDAYEFWEKIPGTMFDLNIELPGHSIAIREYDRGSNLIDVTVGDDLMILTQSDRRAINAAAHSWESWDRKKTSAANRKKAAEAEARVDQHLSKVMWDVLG